MSYIPELPSALLHHIGSRRNVALELRAERNRRLDRPTLRSRIGGWVDHHRARIGAARRPGSQRQPDFHMHR